MTPHPATYTDALLPIFAELLLKSQLAPQVSGTVGPGPAKILDPFAGTGKIARLRAWLPQAEFYGYEIEPEWAEQARAAGCVMHHRRQPADALPRRHVRRHLHEPDLREPHGRSPRGARRQPAPHLPARARPAADARELRGAAMGREEYRALHVAVWTECRRVLKPGGIFVLNVKDHIRGGVLQEVTNWHAVTLLMLGFVCTRRVHVPCPGQRHGANGHLPRGLRVGDSVPCASIPSADARDRPPAALTNPDHPGDSDPNAISNSAISLASAPMLGNGRPAARYQ